MQRIVLALIITALAATVANAQVAYMDGTRLLRQCEPSIQANKGNLYGDQAGDSAFCAGYVAGAMDANNTLISSLQSDKKTPLPPMYCLPKDGMEIGQAVRVTVKWLREHPEKLHLEGDILVSQALRDAFPCK